MELNDVGIEVPIVVTVLVIGYISQIKIVIVWDVTPCSLILGTSILGDLFPLSFTLTMEAV
jgi:hypothetical protein